MSRERIIFLIGVLIVIALIVFLLVRPRPATAPTNDAANANAANAAVTPLPRVRDERRVSDIRTIQSALEAHRLQGAQYPATLDELSPAYFATVPHDPQTGAEYGYTPLGEDLFYSLTYTLEVGVQGMTAGQHTASPDGVDRGS